MGDTAEEESAQPASQYKLLDFGDGRRLERFGPYVLDRPAPAAETARRNQRSLWPAADARYVRGAGETGRWIIRTAMPEAWTFRAGALTLQLKLTPAGHLGLFPDHMPGWAWLAECVQQAVAGQAAGRPLDVLNLFAYTGGATLALAAAGARVVHVDSARGAVAWARRNAADSGLAAAPVRWIVEDARKFVAREVARGNRYDAVVLDPPTYGHGPAGQAWKIADHLAELVAGCRELTGPAPAFMLLACHTPGVGPRELAPLVAGMPGERPEIRPLELVAADGRRLPCGVELRCRGAAAHRIDPSR